MKINNKRLSGRVKWFNSKLGYGFITHKQKGVDCDVFIHWSNLLLSEKEFHTLYKGEYVEFELAACKCSSSNNIGIQACRVSGPNNSQLLTAVYGGASTYIQNTNRFSHIYNVRQLPVSDFSTPDNLSQKAKSYYASESI